MSEGFPGLLRPLMTDGAAFEALRPALLTGPLAAAEAQSSFSTRTLEARAASAAPSSIFERARRWLPGSIEAAPRVWSDFDDNAHVDRRAPPGRNPGGRGQGKSDRGI